MKLSRAEWLSNSTFFSVVVVEAILQVEGGVTTSAVELVKVKELGLPAREVGLFKDKELW